MFCLGRGGRGGGRGGARGGGAAGGAKAVIEPHRHEGVFIARVMGRTREDLLVTRNMVPGESVYGEKRITVEVGSCLFNFCN